jgi:hypothetical protein
MRALIFTKEGKVFLEDNFNKKREEIEHLKNVLDCPVVMEDGVLFDHIFDMIMKDKDYFNVVFGETIGEGLLDNFVEEWNNEKEPLSNKMSFLKAYKVFDYIELPDHKGFVDIRVNFDGMNEQGDVFNLEFIKLNQLKGIPLKLSNNISIHRTVSNLKGEELFFKGESFVILFELIGTILYIITTHVSPEKRERAKKKFIEVISNTNIIEILEQQKDEAVEDQNYEEAAYLKRVLDRLKSG